MVLDPLTLVVSITVRRSPVRPSAREARFVKARSALFDIYGDHLLSRGERAPVAALVRLLAPLRISAPTVFTGMTRHNGTGAGTLSWSSECQAGQPATD